MDRLNMDIKGYSHYILSFFAPVLAKWVWNLSMCHVYEGIIHAFIKSIRLLTMLTP